MTGSNENACPECAAPRNPDSTPTCTCTERAAEALRDTRTAEAAAAEDFDPLRIRPYVELSEGAEGAEGAETGETGETAGAVGGGGDPVTMRLPVVVGAGPESVAEVRAVEPGSEPESRGHRRRTVLLAAGGTVVAVAAAAGIGVFSYNTPQREGAPPRDIRASVPEPSDRSYGTPSAGVSSSAAPSVSTSSSPSASVSPSATESAVSSAPRASSTPSDTPTASRTTGTTNPTASGGGGGGGGQSAPVLSEGDKGAEVKELQLRLKQVFFYFDDADGNYDSGVAQAVANYQTARGISGDEQGVYGAATRARLESETTDP